MRAGKVTAGRCRTLSRKSVELAPTPRRSVPFAAPQGAAEILRLPRLKVVHPAPLLAVLGLLVLVNISRLGEGGWRFRSGKVRPDGELGWFVSAARGHWTAAPLKYSAVAAGLVLVVALVYARERWTARRALLVTLLVSGLLVVPGVLFQAALRESSDPWFYTNDSTYQIEVAGDLVLDGQTPYGHDYRGTGIERFYSRNGSAELDHMALDHFAYFPGAAITSAGWRLLPAPFDDYRFFVLLATLGLIPAALSFAGPLTVRLAVGCECKGAPER